MLQDSLVEFGMVLGMFVLRVGVPMGLMYAACLWVKRRCDCATC